MRMICLLIACRYERRPQVDLGVAWLGDERVGQASIAHSPLDECGDDVVKTLRSRLGAIGYRIEDVDLPLRYRGQHLDDSSAFDGKYR